MLKNNKLTTKQNIRRSQTTGEEIANSISHGIMAIYGIVILIIFILRSHNDPIKIFSSIVYGLSVTLLFLFSCLYHGITNNFTKNHILKRFDHISIYLLIGGTYTPMLLCLKCLNENIFLIGLTEGQFICFVEWILIFIGITFKSIWIKKFKWLHIAIFLLLGWSAMLFIGDLYNNTNEVFLLLILFGGISYTIGVIFYGFQKIPYFHFVWHIFVCIGSILHTIALLIEIYI